MLKLNAKHIVRFLPFAYLGHLLDEFYLGSGFADWFSGLFKISLLESDFLIINSVAFLFVVIITILFNLGKINNFIPTVLGVLFFINGIVHLIITTLTLAYSPGTISGILIYIPFGIIVFKNIFPLLEEKKRTSSIASAIAIHILITIVTVII